MKSLICIVMAVLLSNVHIAFAGTATEMIPTVNIVEDMSRAESVANITELLSREEAQAQLEKFGVTAEQVTQRLATLSDSEIRDLTKQIDQAKFGGDVGGILIVVILVLLIIFLVNRI